MSATTLSTLASSSCSNAAQLSAVGDSEIQNYLGLLPGWSLESGEIAKTFKFADYYHTIAFVNALAWVAHQQDHHPDLAVHYNRCRVAFSTHAVGGITRNDFISAAKIETLCPT